MVERGPSYRHIHCARSRMRTRLRNSNNNNNNNSKHNHRKHNHHHRAIGPSIRRLRGASTTTTAPPRAPRGRSPTSSRATASARSARVYGRSTARPRAGPTTTTPPPRSRPGACPTSTATGSRSRSRPPAMPLRPRMLLPATTRPPHRSDSHRKPPWHHRRLRHLARPRRLARWRPAAATATCTLHRPQATAPMVPRHLAEARRRQQRQPTP